MKGLGAHVLLTLAFALCANGCGHDAGGEREHASTRLPSGVVARVDSDDVTALAVGRILAERGGPAGQAVDRAVHDALFARLARERPDALPVAERAVLGRALRESLLATARQAGPASDEELARLTEANWLELDRPRAVRVVHAVALVKAPEHRERARELATKIARSVQGLTEPNAFAQAAHAATGEQKDIEVRIEPLPPVAADGRVVPVDQLDQGGSFDATFARSATELEQAGQLSPVVETAFGFHVLLAVEVLPEKRVDTELRREALEARVMAARAEPARVELVQKLKAQTPIEVARNFEQLTLQAWTQK